MNASSRLTSVRAISNAVGAVVVIATGSLLTFAAGCSPGLRTGAPASLQRPTPGTTSPLSAAAIANWTIDKPIVGQALPCQAGKVLLFSCKNVDLLSFLPVDSIGGGTMKEIWGWTDPASGREFVLAARSHGTSFVEITDPVHPRYLGELPRTSGTNPTPYRELKVYQHYAFIVADQAGDHGIQIFDLDRLLKASGPPAVFQETAHYNQVASTHNIVIDTATGFAYTVGGPLCGGGLNMIDIHAPMTPKPIGCYSDPLGGAEANRWVHDAQCVIYHGPDRRYRGRELCLNAASSVGLVIADVTDKGEPKTVGVGRYPGLLYAHQGWLTEDQRYFFLGDEEDELSRDIGIYKMKMTDTLSAQDTMYHTRTLVFDLTDLEDPVLVNEFVGTTRAVDHNQYVRGHYLYQANYTAGLRIIDVADPRTPREVAYFDNYPGPDPDDARTRRDQVMSIFQGAWGNYPYFKDGVIAVGSKHEGLSIVRFRAEGAAR